MINKLSIRNLLKTYISCITILTVIFFSIFNVKMLHSQVESIKQVEVNDEKIKELLHLIYKNYRNQEQYKKFFFDKLEDIDKEKLQVYSEKNNEKYWMIAHWFIFIDNKNSIYYIQIGNGNATFSVQCTYLNGKFFIKDITSGIMDFR